MNHQLKFKNMRTGDKVFDIVNYTLLTLIMVIVLYPVLYIVAASFSDPQAVVSGEVFILPVRPTLRGYEAVFKNKKILTGFANSIYYLVVGTLLNLVMTMLCAYPLSRKEFRARGGIAMFFVFTMYFSGGLVPSYILVNSLHLTNTRWAMIIPSAMSTYNMIICLFLFLEEYLRPVFQPSASVTHGILYYSILGIVFMIVMYIFAVLQYRSTYTTVYDESANRRISLAEKLRKLPLAFFGEKNLSDLTATIMDDCTDLEHTFSHAGAAYFDTWQWFNLKQYVILSCTSFSYVLLRLTKPNNLDRPAPQLTVGPEEGKS